MMSRDDNDGKDRLFSFRRQKISDAEIENQSFFRSTVVLEEELNSARLATRIYLSNLKRTNSSFVLRNDFLCILDADWNGNLKETKKENFVFVKLLKLVGRGQKLATQEIQQTISLGACLQIFETKSTHLLIFFTKSKCLEIFTV